MMPNFVKSVLIGVVKFFLPKRIVDNLRTRRESKLSSIFLNKLTNNIISYHKNSNDREIMEVVDYLNNNPIAVFPYKFTKKHKESDITVIEDHEEGLKYVLHENKKLYFKRSMSKKNIISLYKGLLIDQDPDSPHLYLTERFSLSHKDVIADIGAAEGNFTLSNIETVKKAYIFESDPQWIEALEATFKPWKDKVQIINKFVTNYESSTAINIELFYKQHSDISFFKVDIEGEEQNFLNACKPIFSQPCNIKLAICTYHKHNDEINFTKQLENLGFTIQHSNRYMIYLYDKSIKAPYLRRGLIRGLKHLHNDR